MGDSADVVPRGEDEKGAEGGELGVVSRSFLLDVSSSSFSSSSESRLNDFFCV